MIVKFTLDVLKPHKPSNYDVARQLIGLEGVYSIKIRVDEIDQKTTSIFVDMKGNKEMSLEQIENKLEELNCALHSVDQVSFEKEDKDY